jgi:hypothetical protein
MLSIQKTREELEELAAALAHIASLGPNFISPSGAAYWDRKAKFLLGLSDTLEELGTEDLTIANLQAAAERAIQPTSTPS